jgi:hypothetical protein
MEQGPVTTTSRTDLEIGHGPAARSRSTRASTLACWSSAPGSAMPWTPLCVPLRDMGVSLLGVIGMDEVEQLIEAFRTQGRSAVGSRLDVLMDLERLQDPRVVPFLIRVLSDRNQPVEVRIHVVKRLRNGRLATDRRGSVANAISQVLADDSNPPELRLQAALALAEFTDVEGVPLVLGSLALDVTEPLDLRYSAFTSLQRAGPTPESVGLLRQLLADETLGRSARSLLSTWQVE